jgi:hypothetical protein
MSDLAIWHKPRMDRSGSPDYIEVRPLEAEPRCLSLRATGSED